MQVEMRIRAMAFLRSVLLTLCVVNCKMLVAQEALMLDKSPDSTAALQLAVENRKGLILLPPGTFRISKTIEIDLSKTGYCAIRGSSATRLLMTGPGPAFRFVGSHFKSADPAGISDQVWESERMPSVTDLAIEGRHPEADGIEAVGTMQLSLSRLHLRKLRHAIHLLKNNRNVLVDACHIYENAGVGIYYDDVNLHQSNIVGCHISYCDQGGIVSRGGNVRNIHISGCDLEGNVSANTPPTANVYIDCRNSDYGTAEVAITGCTIQHSDDGPDSANIRILGRSNPNAKWGTTREGNVTISGNVLSDVQHNLWLDHCRGVTVTGNTFWMGYQHNLLVENSTNIVVGANNFDRNPRYAYGNALEAKNAIAFRDCQDCTLSSLHVSQVGEGLAGVALYNCDRFHVSGLTILDCAIGLHLSNVSRSSFADCMIHNQRAEEASRELVVEGGTKNRFDASLQK